MTSTPLPLAVEVGPPTGVELNPDLWGLFIEDLNDALDGGLNAELVRNGDFEFSGADREGWGPLTSWTWSGAGQVQVRSEAPLHPSTAHYVRLTGPITLTNEGFDPIAVRQGEAFRLTLASWLLHGPGEVTFAVVSDDGAALASTTLTPAAQGWHHHELDLVGLADGVGRLVIDVPAGLEIEIDVVSLRPVGADGRPLTFRPDLLAALADLAPSFIRFPGGCIAHGLGLGNLYHWKRTIGPRHEREHTFNLWGYHQSRQIGYLEYFELCEAVGATAMPIVAAGVCCQNLRGRADAIPLADMPAYVQDVLDLVEFANGGPDTVWGARRAELGHPEPFALRYLGVGNEDEITDDFRTRYALIADALAQAHPEVVVIGTAGPQPFGEDFEAGWEFARQQGVALVDEHAYRTPRWFHQNLDRYDSYPREGGGVYFGEYAARTNRVRSALAEAAFMIAMERNGDIVRLASYAPLLARVGRTQWVPDLIYFDADSVLRSASYFVQRAFGRHRGQQVHQVTTTGAEPVPVPGWVGGTVRLRATGADLAVREVRIDGAAPGALDGAALGALDGAAPGAFDLVGDGVEVVLGAIGATSDVELLATRTAGTEGFVLVLGGTGEQERLEVSIGGWQNKATSVDVVVDEISNDVAGPTPWPGVLTGVPVKLRVQIADERIRVWVDDELRHDHTLDRRPEQRVVVGALSRPEGGYVVRLVNATDETRDAVVALPLGTGVVTGVATVLAGAGPDEGAPFEASPAQETEIAVGGDDGFTLTLPPWSFAVAVLEQQP